MDDLVHCAGCSEVAGSPVRHLPPACVYDKGRLVETLPSRMVPPEGVMDLLRERVRKPEEVTLDRGKLDEYVEWRTQFGLLITKLLENGEIYDGDSNHPRASEARAWVMGIYRRLKIVEAQRGASWTMLKEQGWQLNKLALFFRAHYQAEIEAGKHNHFPDAVDAAVHYMMVERDLTRRGMWGRLKYVLWGV